MLSTANNFHKTAICHLRHRGPVSSPFYYHLSTLCPRNFLSTRDPKASTFLTLIFHHSRFPLCPRPSLLVVTREVKDWARAWSSTNRLCFRLQGIRNAICASFLLRLLLNDLRADVFACWRCTPKITRIRVAFYGWTTDSRGSWLNAFHHFWDVFSFDYASYILHLGYLIVSI